MARLYADVTSVSVMGGSKPRTIGRTARHELEVHARGWNMGVKVFVEVDDAGREVFSIYKTGGTNGPMKLTPITSFVDEESAGPRDRKGRLK